MIECVDNFLKPWAETAPEHIHLFIILDSYKYNLMSIVKVASDECGVDQFHMIPGGCTG